MNKTYNKEELVAIAKAQGFFDRSNCDLMYASSTGHFYYKVPHGIDCYEIARKEVVKSANKSKREATNEETE